MAVIYDGRARAQMEEEIIRSRVRELKSQYGIFPHLVTILVGDDEASKIYTRLKKEAAERVGIIFTVRVFETDTSSEEIKNFIRNKNKDKKVHGIMVQMPLPGNFDTKSIVGEIDRKKDVDGLRVNSSFVHPTVKAIYQVVEMVATDGVNIVVVGAKGMVGSKTVQYLRKKGYIVDRIDLETKNKTGKLKQADIIISSTGKAGIISKDMVKKGVGIIDVGSPKPEVQKEVGKIAKLITPVPGGIGPMTIAELLKNLTTASEKVLRL